MYSPQLGSFISRDPEEYVEGMNLFEYARSNPTRYTDPTGTDTQFWEFLRCYDACLDHNSPLGAVGRYILNSIEASGAAAKIPIPVSKNLLASFARNVLDDSDLARKVLANAAREGANDLGSLQKFVRLAIRSGKGVEAANFFSKAAEATGVIAALAAVADTAVHTHCIAFCCVLSSNNLRYDPKQDNFIDDWVDYWFSSQAPAAPTPPARRPPAPRSPRSHGPIFYGK